MSYSKQREYSYVVAETNSLYHEAAVKMGISDTVMNILYVLCDNDFQCLQSDIFKLTGISRQTISSAIRKIEKEDLAYLKPVDGKNTMVCLTEKGIAFATEKIMPLYEIENKIWNEWTSEEQEQYLAFAVKFKNSFKKYLREDMKHSTIGENK